MSRAIAANGYESQAKDIFNLPVITQKILQAYHESALIPQLARSDFLNDNELFKGSQAIYGVSGSIDLFGSETDNNEAPQLIDGPSLHHDTMTVCQSKKFEIKITNEDKARMLAGDFDLWEKTLKRQIEVSIRRYIDAYSVPKILASAHRDNVGTKAGKLTHGYNLGDQGGGALTINSEASFEDNLFNMLEVAREAGMTADSSEDIIDGVTAKPIIVIPNQLSRYALRLLKGLNTCCSDENVMRTGIIGTMYGVNIMPTNQLFPVKLGAAGTLNNMMLLDPNRILHAFKVITNKWYEGKFEDYLVGEFIFDTKVLDPHAVVLSTYKA